MKILKLSSKNQKEIIEEVRKAIKEEKVIVLPTDTVYGLVCDATNEKAVEKVFKIKRRKIGKPIPIFIKDLKMAKKLAFVDKRQEKFLKKMWPGKVTVILRPKRLQPTLVPPVPSGGPAGPYKFPKGIGKPKKEIGLRIPNYKMINQLLLNINRPLTGTSANISGMPPSTKIKEVLKQFKNQKYQPDLVIDVGNLKPSKPSTVIDITTSPPKILRQ